MPTPDVVTDPDPHARCGERRFDRVRIDGARYVFVLPRTAEPFRLVSRAAAANAVRPWIGDDRRLGIRVAHLRVRRGAAIEAISLDDPALRDGWWQVEDDRGPTRWTNGDAALPISGPCVLEVSVVGAVPYPEVAAEERLTRRAGRSF